MKKTIGLIAVVGLAIMWGVGHYNGFVTMETEIDEAWGQVQVQYQRRYDLIPNLVETVKGVANFEKETYEAVTEARSAWAQAQQGGSQAEQIEATQNVESALARLLVTVENYPQLRANENFTALQAQIEGTENRVAVSRQDYNEMITPYNKKVRTIPSNLIALIAGFDQKEFFEGNQGSENAPDVNFDFGSDDE